MSLPTTPREIADRLHAIADQLAAIPDADVPTTAKFGIHVNLSIISETPTEVDQIAVALFGRPARPYAYRSGSWQHTTAHSADHVHPTGVNVFVHCGIEDPTIATARAEREALLAEVEQLRAERAAAESQHSSTQDGA